MKFLYPPVTTLVPANIAIVKNAPNPKAAGAFIEYLLSAEGQQVLLDPKIRRLPVNPATYAQAPADFPNPFKDKSLGAAVKFDLELSKNRYNVINSLFDVMVTYRLKDLRAATKAIQDAEATIAGKSNSAGGRSSSTKPRRWWRRCPSRPPRRASRTSTASSRRSARRPPPRWTGRQAEIEQAWDAKVKANYNQAATLAKKAASML